MDIDFKGKTALVTGGARGAMTIKNSVGIGHDISIALAKCGAKVIAVGKSQEHLDALKEECPGIKVVRVDMSDWTSCKKAIESLGPVDLLVNNAGTTAIFPFLEVPEEAIDDVFAVNVKAVVNVSQVIAKGMVERGHGGAIVNISSAASQRALMDHTVYCASKGALDQITKVMALELGPHKIRVNSVHPTVTMTDMGRQAWSAPDKSRPMLAKIPLGRFVEVQEVVQPVLFLLSDRASMVHGAALPVEGGIWVS